MEELRQSEKENFPLRTEEVQFIIDRMPNKFGKVITIIVLTIFLLLLAFGWFIRYPDVVAGQISINTNQAPIKLVAAHAGKLKLLGLQSQENVRDGQVIAWLENPAVLGDVMLISHVTDSLVLPIRYAQELYDDLPKDVSLGELSSMYFSFLNATKQLADYHTNKLYDKQIFALETLLQEQQEVLNASLNKASIGRENLELFSRVGARDSTLHSRQIISDADMDRSKINAIGARDSYEGAARDVASSREQIGRTQSQLQELRIQQSEKEQQLDLEFLTAYNDLRDNLTSWEQRYVFRAPFDGQVQFLNFWNENQFIQASEAVFTVCA